ncbi:hypothetical protein Q4534_12180 [Cyclobacterium sp. 1_MG-2023]|uniref:transporter n=1 Tax=Cyclobacterium sp. 1_MG-2023 TaxID=3062681 RepID=UPI0026E18AB8|nr:transporter [Cyclobacterium sp. 1_MG-2023]MDO6438174.1 hypothetical protein [Cyclobacterium sp. 1_MG-2023]
MSKLLTIAGLLFFTMGGLSAQNLDLHFNLGHFTITDQRAIELPSVGLNANLGFFYQVDNHWSMGVSLNRSWNNYYRESMAGTPVMGIPLPLNGTLTSDHFSFMVNRKLELPFSILLEGGVGLGMYVDRNNYYEPVYFNEDKQEYRGFFNVDDYTQGITFPAQFSLRKEFYNKWSIGIQGAVYYDQFFKRRGKYFGPRLGFYL